MAITQQIQQLLKKNQLSNVLFEVLLEKNK